MRPGTPSVRLPRARLACSLALLGALVSCRAADVRAYNLEQLHAQDGTHHYSAALEGWFEYWYRHEVVPLLGGEKGLLGKKSPKGVKDPAETCLDELLALEKLDVTDRYNRARTIQWSARLAVDDPSLLSRERALYVLARAAVPLGTILPLPPPKDRPVASPDAVSSALGSLVAAARPMLGLSEWNATTQADLQAAIELVRGLNLDLDGARRALEVVAGIAQRAGWKGRGAPLESLAADLERSCVSRSISRALGDPAPRTAAAAIEACETVAGRGVLAGLLLRAASQPRTPVLVLERILDGLRAGGLVRESPEPGAPPPAELVEAQLQALYSLALVREEPELRVAAMSTLSAVSGSGIHSLREEDWQGWWDLHNARAVPGGKGP